MIGMSPFESTGVTDAAEIDKTRKIGARHYYHSTVVGPLLTSPAFRLVRGTRMKRGDHIRQG